MTPPSDLASSDASSGRPDLSGRAFACGLAGLLVLAAAVRLVFLAVLAPVFFHGEELEKGAAAKALLADVPWDYPQLAYHLYEGGGFWISHLEALSFRLVGDSLFGLKLVGLVWGLLLIASGCLLVRRLFGGRAALFFGLLLLFAPRPFQLLALLVLGIHFEACLFLALVLERGWTLLQSHRARDGLLLGIVSGLGIYFSYQLVPAVGWVGLVLLIRAPRVVWGRPGLCGVAGLLLGLAPFLAAYLSVGSALFDIHGTDLTAAERDRWADLRAFAESLLLQGNGLVRGLHGLYLAVVLVSCALAWKLGRGAGLFLLGFLGVWIATYLGSGFVIGGVYHHFQWMRLAPFVFVATMLVALLSARQPLVGWAFVLLGMAQSGHIVATSPGQGFSLQPMLTTPGYDYEGYLKKVLARLGTEPHVLRGTSVLRVEGSDLLVTDVARAAWNARPEPATVEALRETFPDDGAALARGLGGWAWLQGNREGRPGGWTGALQFARTLQEPWSSALQHGAGFRGPGGGWTAAAIEAELQLLPNDPAMEPYLRGIGERIHRRLLQTPYGQDRLLRPDAVRDWIGTLREDQRPVLLKGFEESLARVTQELRFQAR